MNTRILALCIALLLAGVFATGLRYSGHQQKRGGSIPIEPPAQQGHTPVISPTEITWEMLAEIDPDRALDDVRRLTGEEPICADSGCYTITNRFTGSEGLRWATDYISKELVGLGYSVTPQQWSRSGYTDRNLVAKKTGVLSPTEEIYFVAHVDGVRRNASERFPAADDNGSGSVDNLELARILSSHSFSRTVVLLFTTGEEQGRLGALSYLDQLSQAELSSIKYAVNVDMVGYDGNGDGVMELWHGGHAPSMALTELMSDTIRAYELALTPKFVVGCG
jgi:acetylornithine deacetylase/succinyl-diaminopimelate desuccinylase-like protein